MAPYEMRDAWMKVEAMPLSEVQTDPEHVFNVISTVAVSALRMKDPKAAAWWEMHCDVSDDVLFAFPRRICELLPDEAAVKRHPVAAMTASNRRA